MKIIPFIAIVLVVVTQSGCLSHRAARYALRRGRDAARSHAEARRDARNAAEARDAQEFRDPQSAPKPSWTYDQPDRR